MNAVVGVEISIFVGFELPKLLLHGDVLTNLTLLICGWEIGASD